MTSTAAELTDPYKDMRPVMHPGLAHKFGEAFLPALLPWLSMAWENGRTAALVDAIDRVMGPSEHLRDGGTCRDIANELRDVQRRVGGTE